MDQMRTMCQKMNKLIYIHSLFEEVINTTPQQRSN